MQCIATVIDVKAAKTKQIRHSPDLAVNYFDVNKKQLKISSKAFQQNFEEILTVESDFWYFHPYPRYSTIFEHHFPSEMGHFPPNILSQMLWNQVETMSFDRTKLDSTSINVSRRLNSKTSKQIAKNVRFWAFSVDHPPENPPENGEKWKKQFFFKTKTIADTIGPI